MNKQKLKPNQKYSESITEELKNSMTVWSLSCKRLSFLWTSNQLPHQKTITVSLKAIKSLKWDQLHRLGESQLKADWPSSELVD